MSQAWCKLVCKLLHFHALGAVPASRYHRFVRIAKENEPQEIIRKLAQERVDGKNSIDRKCSPLKSFPKSLAYRPLQTDSSSRTKSQAHSVDLVMS